MQALNLNSLISDAFRTTTILHIKASLVCFETGFGGEWCGSVLSILGLHPTHGFTQGSGLRRDLGGNRRGIGGDYF